MLFPITVKTKYHKYLSWSCHIKLMVRVQKDFAWKLIVALVENSAMMHLVLKSHQQKTPSPASHQLFSYWILISLFYRLFSQRFRKKYISVQLSRPCSSYKSGEMSKTLLLLLQLSEKIDLLKHTYNEMWEAWWTGYAQGFIIYQMSLNSGLRG